MIKLSSLEQVADLWKTPVFEVGQEVVCICAERDSDVLTKGARYRVLEYAAPIPTPHYTWPAYVTVEGARGRKISCHANRFKSLQKGSA